MGKTAYHSRPTVARPEPAAHHRTVAPTDPSSSAPPSSPTPHPRTHHAPSPRTSSTTVHRRHQGPRLQGADRGVVLMNTPTRFLTTVLWATTLPVATVVAGSGCGKSSWPNDVCLQPPLTEAVATDEETPVGSAVAWAHVITEGRSWEVVESVGFVGVIGTTPDVAWLGEVMPTDGPHAPQLLHVGTDCEPWLRFYWRETSSSRRSASRSLRSPPYWCTGSPPHFGCSLSH